MLGVYPLALMCVVSMPTEAQGHNSSHRARGLGKSPDYMPKAPPPHRFGRVDPDGRFVRQVLVGEQGGLRAVEYLRHLRVVLHHPVEPRVVVGVLLVADARRHVHQPVVGVHARRDQHHPVPVTFQVASIHAQDLSQTQVWNRKPGRQGSQVNWFGR